MAGGRREMKAKVQLELRVGKGNRARLRARRSPCLSLALLVAGLYTFPKLEKIGWSIEFKLGERPHLTSLGQWEMKTELQ
ncbi:hypothetical protein A6R68_20746 [Neotoma lepida]|uniref:Uncharacterized protein n=1 Tax=Neotoma lepida TaxID=56216 RepID=A0A1A6HS25_NEOLE|nr:hypothetical protein A6R68_20746 [Neotoma lepida]